MRRRQRVFRSSRTSVDRQLTSFFIDHPKRPMKHKAAGSEQTVTNFEDLDEFPKALLSSVLELLAERKVNHPGAALTLCHQMTSFPLGI